MPITRSRLLAALVAVVLVALGCTQPPPGPLPPIKSVGEAIIGPNPPVEGTPGARRTVITYGPWTVPGATGAGHHGAGMKEDIRFAVARPCTNCYITGATPRLTYASGASANTDTGLWLHHFALASSGGVDARCDKVLGLAGEVFFTGANERTAARSPAGTGYRTGPLDSWSLLVDLMNTGPTAKDVRLEMTYDWVPASTAGMHAIRPVILDAGQVCTNSNLTAGTGRYSHKSTWTVTVPGRVIGIAGHEHDGGSGVTLRNLTTGDVLCDATAHYGGPGFEEPATAGGGHEHSGAGDVISHLSAVDQCIARGVDRPVAVIRRGDQLEIEAFYDADLHPHDPGEPVMGLIFMFVLPEEAT
jgi:hypothetical protein